MNTEGWEFYFCTYCGLKFGLKDGGHYECPNCGDAKDINRITKEEAFE